MKNGPPKDIKIHQKWDLGRPLVDLSCLRQYSRPGPRTVRLHAEICVWLQCKRQSAGDLRTRVLRITISDQKWCQEGSNGAKMAPAATKMEPKGTKRVQNGAKRAPKSTRSHQNGAKRVPKGSEGATKRHPKIDARKRSPKGGA